MQPFADLAVLLFERSQVSDETPVNVDMGTAAILETPQSNDEWDFGEALTRVQPRLLAYARRQIAKGLGFRNAAFSSDDLSAETLRKSWEHKERFMQQRIDYREQHPETHQHDDDALFFWSCTILRNTFLNWTQKSSAEIQDDIRMQLAEDTSASTAPEWKAKEREVRQALGALGTDCQKILALAGLGYTYAEMEAQLNISNANVKSRLSRCRSKLSNHLGIKPNDFLN